MYCPKCQKEINTGNKFCTNCGSRLLENETIESNLQLNEGSNSSIIDNISMVEAYVGNSYTRLRDVGFSLWFLLFGINYSLYRKMYAFSFVYIIASAIFMMISPTLYLILDFVVRIVLSIKFNSIYLTHVSGIVEKIRKSNPGKNRVEMLKICRNSGGVSSINILLGFVINGALSMAFMKNYYTDFLANHGLYKTNESEYGELSFLAPKDFVRETNNSGQVLYTYNDNKSNYCDFEIVLTSTPNTAHQFLNSKNIYTNNDEKTFQDKSINSNNWTLLVATNKKTNTVVYDYAIIHNHVLYNVTYRIFKDNNKCNSFKEELENTLKLNDSEQKES